MGLTKRFLGHFDRPACINTLSFSFLDFYGYNLAVWTIAWALRILFAPIIVESCSFQLKSALNQIFVLIKFESYPFSFVL
jgi:hypothetical protein